MHEPYHPCRQTDPFTEDEESKAMSRIGRYLLEHCSNDMRIDLGACAGDFHLLGFKLAMVRLTALHLGITLEGGS